MKRFDRNTTAGFTLLELIIVMGIIMTIAGLSITVIKMIAKDEAMSQTAIRIENIIVKYRDAAMRKHEPYQIVFDRHRNSMRVFWCGPDGVLDGPGETTAGRDDELVEEFFLEWDMFFDKAVIERQYMLNSLASPKSAPLPPDDPKDGHPDYNGSQDNEDEVYATGVLILNIDGSIQFAKMRPIPGDFTAVPRYAKTTSDEDEEGEGESETTAPNLEDEPPFNVSYSKFLDKTDAEIIISRIGEFKKILIEINPYTGKIHWQITELKKEDEDVQGNEEQ